MRRRQIESHSPEETQRIAGRLALLLRPGDVITLEGDLGAGKTTFTKGLATGLGIKKTLSSPTFTIVKEYEGELPLYHMDAYRLENSDEDIGFDEYFHGNGICVVEWARFIEDYLPDEILAITLHYVDDHTRTLEFLPQGLQYERMIDELFE